jgi:hypothetical protein
MYEQGIFLLSSMNASLPNARGGGNRVMHAAPALEGKRTRAGM